jgi:iron complex transport system substrate-binding protein
MLTAIPSESIFQTPMKTPRILFSLMCLIFGAALSGFPQSSVRPQRIISISPVITEILFGIGAFDRVVAVSDYCTYPEAVKTRPRVGGWINTNFEKILSLRPDLVLITEPQAPFVAEQFRKLKIQYAVIPSQNLADVFTAIDQIGRAVGQQAEAARLAQQTRAEVDAVRMRTKNLVKRRVIAVVDRTPGTLRELTVATPGSFLAELVEIAGGQLVTTPTKAGYVTINKEAMVSLDAEMILDIAHTPSKQLGEDQQDVWAPMSALRAVRERKVRLIRDEFILHTSQFVSRTVKLLAATMHPEVFKQENK